MIGVKIGGKLHTARSRNDQVQVDVDLWLQKSVKEIQAELVCAMGPVHILYSLYSIVYT